MASKRIEDRDTIIGFDRYGDYSVELRGTRDKNGDTKISKINYMTKRIEDIKKGDRFTKGDWTFEIDSHHYLGGSPVFNVKPTFDHTSTVWLTTSQIESIDTWIEDISISQAAADAIKKKSMDIPVDSFAFTDFIQSLVKK
jgi:hypothetical protein